MNCVSCDSFCSSEVRTEDVEFVEAQQLVVSEVKEYQQVQSSHVDPTVDSDNDFEEAPLSDKLVACVGLGECGAPGCVEFTAADAEQHIASKSVVRESDSTSW